jgi:hypothetical protein
MLKAILAIDFRVFVNLPGNLPPLGFTKNKN